MIKLTKYNKALLMMLLLISSISSYGQFTVSVPFSNGFVGVNAANNKATTAYPLSSLGLTNVKFSQNSTATNFTLQGNDITGNVLITDNSGVEHSIPGFIKWRAPSGTITTMVFQPLPATNKTIATNGLNGSSSYIVTDLTYIGLTFNGKTLTISPVPGTVSGNAATSGLLDELNAYLATFTSISTSDILVNESAGTVTLTVTLSAPLTSAASFSYATTNDTAIAGSDYTAISGTFSLPISPTTLSYTFTIPIINDLVSELTETFNFVLSNPLNVSITDGTGIVTVTDDDNTSPTISISGHISPFTSCAGSVSVEQSGQVAGSNLTANLVVTAPTGYEISLTPGTGFVSTFTLTPSAGTVAPTTIYLRLAANALNGASGDIVMTSTGATTVNVPTGIAVVSPPSVAGTITGATNVCTGTNSTLLTLGGNTGTIQWQSSPDNNIFTDISGETGQTYTAIDLTATTYYRAVVQSGVCSSATTASVTITVNPTTVAGTITGDATVCSGTNSTLLTLGGNTGTVVKWQSATTSDFSGTITDINSTSTTYTATNLAATTYYKAVVQSGACASATTAVAATITVNPTPVIAAVATTICSGNAATVSPTNGGGITSTDIVPNGTTYSWSAPTVIGLTGMASGSAASSFASGTLVNTTNSAKSVTYSVTPTIGSCVGTAFDIVVTVNPTPVIAAVATTICSGNAATVSPTNGGGITSSDIVPTGTTYSWSAPTLTGLTGMASGTASSSFASGTLTNSTNAALSVTFSVTPTTGSCVGTAFNIVVTVNPKPVIAVVATTICSGSEFSVTPVDGTGTDVVPAGTLYTWSVADNASVTGEANNLGTTFIGESNTNSTGNYGFGDSYDSIDGWSDYPQDVGQSFTATQSATLTAITVKFPSIIISGTATLNVYSGAGKSGSLLSTQTISVATTGDNTFTLATPVNTVSGQVYTFILFTAPRSMDARISSSPDLYSGGSVYIYHSGVGGAGGNDIYFKTHYGTNPASTISGTLTNTSSTNQNVVYSVTPVSALGCSGTPFNVTVTVNPTTVAGNITGAATVCAVTNSTTLTLVNNVGTVVKWQSALTSNFSGTITDISSINTTYDATNLTATTYYRAVVKSGTCAEATTAAVEVTVNPLPEAVVYGVSTICDGKTIVLSAANSALNINYTAPLGSEAITQATSGWQSFTSGVSGNLSKVSFGFKNTSNTASFVAKLNIYSGEGNTNPNIGPNPAPNPNLLTSQYVTINQPTSGFVTQDFILQSPVALSASGVYTAELVAASPVNKISFFNSDSTTNLAGGTSNVNSSTDYYFTNEVIPTPSGLTYQWQVNTGSGYANVATNGTNQFIAPAIAGDYKVTITNTTTLCSNTSAAKTVAVDPKPIANAGADAKICGTTLTTTTTNATYTLSGSSSNYSSIFWFSSGTGTFTGGTTATPVYTPSPADKLAGAVNLAMIVGGLGSCASEVVFDQMTLSFGLAPTSNAGIDASICSNTTFKTEAYATNGTVLWTRSGDGTFDDATLMNPTYTPGSADKTAGSVTLTMTVTGTETSCTTTTIADTVVLTVAPAPTASAGPADVKVCSGLTYTATTAAATNGTILWTTSGNGSFSSTTTEKPTYTPSADDITATSVDLTMTVTGTSCNAVSKIKLLFTPVPVANAGIDAALCSDAIFSTSGIASGGTIKWTTSGTGLFSHDTDLNTDYTPSSTDRNVTLTLTVTGINECASLAPVVDTMVLSVSPAPTASAGPDATICSDTTFQTQGLATNGTILWTTSGTGSFTGGTTATPVYTPSVADKLLGNVTLTITVTGLTGTSCDGKVVFDTINLLIAPLPTANAGPATDHICAGSNFTLGGTATDGVISWGTSGTGTFTGGTTATPVYTPSATDITAGTVRLTMTVTGNAACTIPTDFIDLTIFTVALVDTQIDVTCNGLSNGSASVSPSGGTAPYTYAWRKSGSSTVISNLYSAINLTAGTYSCVVTDANLCTATSNFIISQPAALTATTSQTNVSTFNGTDGSATVVGTGGTSPYTYVWSPSVGSGATVSNLMAGTYTCTIIDANGCSVVKNFTITEPSNFTATITQTNILCNAATTGSASVTVTGGVSPITYSWSPSGGAAATASNLVAGTYTCTIKDNNGAGLTITKTVTITQPSALTATTSQTNVLIYGNATGVVGVNVSGGNSPYTYSWTNSSSTSSSISGLTAGTYTCTIRDANACSTTKTIIITQPLILSSTGSSSTNVTCNGAATGTATMAITGGVTPYAYVWTPSVSTGSTASNLVAGTYSCTVTDANGAIQTKSFVISQPTVLTASVSQTNVSCFGGSNGSAAVVVSGGTSGYTYSWFPSGGTGATASGLTAGVYTCTITDSKGCTLPKSFTISEPADLTASVSQTNVAIFGASTGSASVNVSGGTTPYSYSWSPSGGTASTASNLAAGSYTVTITDAKGCYITKTFAINQPSSLLVTPSQTNVLCNGAATGVATVSVSGGSTTYQYLWSPSGGTAATATGLVAGSYTCTITDTNGAFLVQPFIITQPSLLTATTTQTNVAINGGNTGVASVTVSAGTPGSGYTYLWKNSLNTTLSILDTASGLKAGTYTCTITDANSCSIDKTVLITEPTALATSTSSTSQTNVLCNGGTNGAASVSITGGVLPYSYSWSPSVGTGASVTGLGFGTYTCTITDANGASIVESFTITQPTALTATPSQTNVSCSAGANGSATVTATGGTPGYTYLWFPSGGTSATAINLVAGAYSCTITDFNGCSIVKSFTITQPTALTATTTQTNVAINGYSSGVATVSVSGGTAEYSYLWSPSGGTAAAATGLAAGTYTCAITDANGCQTTKTVTITEPTALLVASISQTNVLCKGASTGVATVNVSGAVGPYTYSWLPSGGTGATANNLVADTYVCTITDANNSIKTREFTITEPTLLAAATTQTDVACYAGVTGAASVSVSGGTAPYTYSWYPSGGLGASVSNLAAGTYTCTITDANGCTLTKPFTIAQPLAALTATQDQSNVSCNSGSNGTATVFVSGGTSNYTYSWTNSSSTSATASGLVAGSYACTVTDAHGCIITKSFVISQPSALAATTSQTNVLCNGSSTGTAAVVVSGGVSPYTYLWTNSGGTEATASGLAAGNYECTITDANGCKLLKLFTITQPAALSVTPIYTDVAISGQATGSASVTVLGGTLPYSYSWTNSLSTIISTSATASNLAAGSYTYTITDAKGCVETETFAINQPSPLTALTTPQTNVLCNGDATGSASVTVSGGTASYNYLWSPSGGSSAIASNLVAGSYTCTITDSNGALLVKSFTITQPSLLTAATTQTNVAINGKNTGVATVNVSGGTTGYSYSWLPSGGSGATASNLLAGTYTCTITDANLCSITKTFTITEPTALATSSKSQTNVLCNGGTNGAAGVSITGGVLPYTYLWSPSVGTGASVTGLNAGTYVCLVTDANGGTIEESFTISEPTALTATPSQTNVSCSAGSNGTATVIPLGGTGEYSYSWSPSGGTAATAIDLVAGSYTCTITDTNGCSLQKTFTITQPIALTATTTQTNVAINGDSSGIASVNVSGGTTGYSYLWKDSLNSTLSSTIATASGLVSGVYTCTITDAKGCFINKTFVITQPTALVASTSQTNVLCNGASTGVARVTASGAVGPYKYSWTNSLSTSATASNLVAGTYICTITDANNSIITREFNITEAAVIPLPIADAGPITDNICSGSNYTTSGIATNGTVSWTTSGSGTFINASSAISLYMPSASDIVTGSVVLTMKVTANGSCNIPSVSDSLLLTIYPTSNAGIIAGATTVCNGINSTVLTLSEYTGEVQWEVSTDNVNFNTIPTAISATYTVTNLGSTTYYRAVVTSGVCSSATSASATIVVSPTSVAGTISGAAPVCYGSNSTELSVSGNIGTIKWQSSTDNNIFVTIPSATSSTYTASNLTTTTYYRAVSTSGVCSAAIANATIVVNPLPIANAGPSKASICAGTDYTTAGIATNGTVFWTTSGTGNFANENNAITTYTPSSMDQTNGSVALTMTVTGSTSGCTLNTDSDTILVTISLPAEPVAAVNQNLCYLVNPTVFDLQTTTGTNVKWYAAPLGGVALDINTLLVSGNTYYATQNVLGCESITRAPVLVNLTCNINAVADKLNLVNGYTGGTTTSVLENDLLNGATLDPLKVILSAVATPSGFTLNPDGTITVPSGTPSGNYQLTYKICEFLYPLNCNQATATVVVIPPVISAIADNYGPLNGFQGVTTPSVLDNDLLNGVIASPNEINLSVVNLPSPLVMNPNGTISVPPGTASGIYVVNYKITEKLNPTNFSQITVVVTVGDCLIFPTNDCDGDGVTNAQEILDNTNPSDSCSMNFANQTETTTPIWNTSDCDGDGVTNAQEILDGTNPTDLCSFELSNKTLSASADWNNSDCDGDGVRNGQEIVDGTDPSLVCSFNPIHISTITSTIWKNSDCDGDGVTNGQELLDGTNSVDVCSFNPSNQTLASSSAWKNADCDGDGVTNGQELLDGTNPGDLCSFNPASITLTTSTAWNNSDCDGDGVTNGKEIADRTNPKDTCSFVTANQTLNTSTVWDNQDCDGDGVTNGREIVDKTNPLESCSLVTARQTLTPSTLWKNSDCDGDGVTNGQEVIDGTDVNNPCNSNSVHVTLELSQAFLAGDCDGDGLTNGEEIGQFPTKSNDSDNNGITDYLEFNNHKVAEDNLEIFNVVTPNGNGDNDVLVIRNIELYPNNTLTVFNRWGVVVYEVDSYGQDNKFFTGISEGRSTMRKLEELPVETYFYTLRYVNSEGVEKQRSGYLYLNK
jgi:gliding motility-associated-like protein